MGARLLITEQGRQFYVKNPKEDFHTEFGYVSAEDLKKPAGSEVKANTGRAFILLKAGYLDSYRRISRAPQIIPRKDIALIIAETGLGKDSIVVDAGTGSGALAILLSHITKEVVSYELRPDFAKVAVKNKEFMAADNLTIKQRDVYEGIDERNVDVITLDLPEPWRAIGACAEALSVGGYLVSFSPTVPQVMDFVRCLAPRFTHLKTSELLEREWDVSERKVRPRSMTIGHSGFLTFARKLR